MRSTFIAVLIASLAVGTACRDNTDRELEHRVAARLATEPDGTKVGVAAEDGTVSCGPS